MNLETIFTFSSQPQSQTLPSVFMNANKVSVKLFQRGGSKGDFIALVSRGVDKEISMVKTLAKHLSKEGIKVKHFNFPNLARPPDKVTNLERYSDVWNSTSGRFWFGPENLSFPAVTLSDLGQWRSQATSCTTATCSTAQIRRVFNVKTKLLAATSRAIVNTVKELTTTETVPEKMKDHQKLYSLLATFLTSMTSWQTRIEERLVRLEHLYAGQNVNSLDTVEPKGNHSYLVLSNKAIDIPRLKDVISDYYRASNETGRPVNSPMVIKLVS